MVLCMVPAYAAGGYQYLFIHLFNHFNNVVAMEEENLNIEWHIKQRVLKALNKFKNDFKAAAALGINARTLYSYKKRFDIERCPETKEYSFKNTKV